MFGEKTRPVSDFIPRVMIHIDGVDTDLVATYIMDAIIQFSRESKILTETVCIDLDPCVHSYKVHTKHRIQEVAFARLFVNGYMVNTDDIFYRLEGDTLYVGDTPACGSRLMELTLVVSPARDSLDVPDVFYEDWAEAVVALTLTKLYLLTDNEWYDVQAASNQQALYTRLLRRAIISRVTRHKPLRMRLKNKRRL